MKDQNKNKRYNESERKIENIKREINFIRSKSKLLGKGKIKANLNNSQLGQSMQIGIEMAVSIALGAFIGFQIDKWLDSSPIMFIVCFLLGACSGILTSYRTIKKMGLSPIVSNINKKQKNLEK